MKKLRTRQHIIEDLGLNHIEKQILLSGNILRRFGENDYGYDGMIDTFNEQGETENLSFKIKFKVPPRPGFSKILSDPTKDQNGY